MFGSKGRRGGRWEHRGGRGGAGSVPREGRWGGGGGVLKGGWGSREVGHVTSCKTKMLFLIENKMSLSHTQAKCFFSFFL